MFCLIIIEIRCYREVDILVINLRHESGKFSHPHLYLNGKKWAKFTFNITNSSMRH